jgi:hypothetical protein
MKFKTWVENEIDGRSADMMPASAEVIKTGLQPQVDSKEISTRQKEEHDKLMALDGHFQRIETIIPNLKTPDSPKLKQIESFCKAVLAKWEEIKRADDQGGDIQHSSANDPDPARVAWMKQNQPPPEPLKSMAGQAAF